MDPQSFYRIMLFMLARDSVAMGFSLANFFANGGKTILINGSAQYLGYIASKAVNNNVTIDQVFPIIANTPLAAEFLRATATAAMPGQPERVASVVLVFTTSAFLTKTGDIPTNASMGALVGAFVEYMASVISNSNTHIPFALIGRGKRHNLTFTQHLKMHLILSGCLVAIVGGSIIIVYVIKGYIKRGRLLFKRSIKIIKTVKEFRRKRLNNSNSVLVKCIRLDE